VTRVVGDGHRWGASSPANVSECESLEVSGSNSAVRRHRSGTGSDARTRSGVYGTGPDLRAGPRPAAGASRNRRPSRNIVVFSAMAVIAPATPSAREWNRHCGQADADVGQRSHHDDPDGHAAVCGADAPRSTAGAGMAAAVASGLRPLIRRSGVQSISASKSRQLASQTSAGSSARRAVSDARLDVALSPIRVSSARGPAQARRTAPGRFVSAGVSRARTRCGQITHVDAGP